MLLVLSSIFFCFFFGFSIDVAFLIQLKGAEAFQGSCKVSALAAACQLSGSAYGTAIGTDTGSTYEYESILWAVDKIELFYGMLQESH